MYQEVFPNYEKIKAECEGKNLIQTCLILTSHINSRSDYRPIKKKFIGFVIRNVEEAGIDLSFSQLYFMLEHLIYSHELKKKNRLIPCLREDTFL